MKFAIVLLLAGASCIQGLSTVVGTWFQTMASRYTINVYEIDWFCTKATLTHGVGAGNYDLKFSAHLHSETGPPPVTVSHRAYIIGNQFAVENVVYDPSVKNKTRVYDIHEISDYTVILTSTTDLAMVVWTRNVTEYYDNDQVKTLSRLTALNFTDHSDTWYDSCKV